MKFFPIILGEHVWSINDVFKKNHGYPNEVLKAIIIDEKLSENINLGKIVEDDDCGFNDAFKI